MSTPAAPPAPQALAPQLPAIVLCEPDTLLRELLCECLRQARYEPLNGDGDGDVPLARVLLVVADLPAPRRDGAARIAILRQRFPGARVLAISAQFMPGMGRAPEAAPGLGADALLAKPFTCAAFMEAVRALTG
jgi:CheY-like chemotaxis protein